MSEELVGYGPSATSLLDIPLEITKPPVGTPLKPVPEQGQLGLTLANEITIPKWAKEDEILSEYTLPWTFPEELCKALGFRLRGAILVHISYDGEEVVASLSALDHYGHGPSLELALDDLARAMVDDFGYLKKRANSLSQYLKRQLHILEDLLVPVE